MANHLQHPHGTARVSPSILRLSALTRVGGVLLILAILWVAIFWVIGT